MFFQPGLKVGFFVHLSVVRYLSSVRSICSFYVVAVAVAEHLTFHIYYGKPCSFQGPGK